MMGGFGGAGMLLWIVLIVVLIWWFTQVVTNQRGAGQKPQTRTPRELLDERLARGEITLEQHRELRKALG